MTKRILTGATSLLLAVSMFTACGDGAKKEEKKDSTTSSIQKEAADKVLSDEFSKIETLKDKNGGNITIQLTYDSVTGKSEVTWDNLTEALSHGSTESFDYDFSSEIYLKWADTSYVMAFDLFGESVTTIAFDGENYYIDLTKTNDILERTGLSDPSYTEKGENGIAISDMFTKIKIPKGEIDSFSEYLKTNLGSESDIDTETIQTVIFNEDIINELKSLSSKADYEGDDITIKGLTEEDFIPLVETIKESISGISEDLASEMPDIAPDSNNDSEETESGTDENNSPVVDYKLSFTSDKINQTHDIVMTDNSGNIMTLTIRVKESDDKLDLSNFSDAKTFSDIIGVSFDQFAEMMFGNLLITDTGEWEYDDYSEDNVLQEDTSTNDVVTYEINEY